MHLYRYSVIPTAIYKYNTVLTRYNVRNLLLHNIIYTELEYGTHGHMIFGFVTLVTGNIG